MTADNSSDQETQKEPRWPILGAESAIAVAIASGVLYLSGHQYLESYYGKLGFGQADITFAIPHVMVTSILPLLHPVFYGVILAAACLALRENLMSTTSLNPFHPIPFVQAVAVVLSLWMIKLLADVIAPAANVTWMVWPRRDVIFFGVGVAVVASFYGVHWARRHRPSFLSSRTALSASLAFYTATAVVVLFLYASTGEWPLTTVQNVALAVAAALVVVHVVWELRGWQRGDRRRDDSSTSARTRPGGAASSHVAFGLVAGMALILVVSLPGTIQAQEDLAGCNSFTHVSFEPLPPGIPDNGTMRLVLHKDGMFFVLVSGPDGDLKPVLVPEMPGMTARLVLAPPPNDC